MAERAPADPAAARDRARAEFRAFVRRHHPDRGGDPHIFDAGVRAYRRQLAARRGEVPSVHHRRSGLGVVLDWWLTRRAAHRRPPRVH